MSVEKVKDPEGGGPLDPGSVAVHDVWVATVIELGLQVTDIADPEVIARLKELDPLACAASPG